jgi:hypothetical protein
MAEMVGLMVKYQNEWKLRVIVLNREYYLIFIKRLHFLVIQRFTTLVTTRKPSVFLM